MTKPRQKRDNEYYLNRLQAEHPAIFADYQAGKYKNATQAFTAAGFHKTRTQLQQLESAWKKATPAEKDAFKASIGCAPTVATSPVRVSSSASAALKTRSSTTAPAKTRLTATEAKAIHEIMDRRKLKSGAVMGEIGFDPLNPSMGMALQRNTQIRSDMHQALKQWIVDNT